jgi:hypothetical protein
VKKRNLLPDARRFGTLFPFLASAIMACGTAFASGGGDIPCGSKAGYVNEFSINPANFTVTISGANAHILNPQPPGFPVTVAGVADPNGGFRARVNIPAFGFNCDVHNRIIPLPKNHNGVAGGDLPSITDNGGEDSELDLESLAFDTSTLTFSLQDLFGTIEQAVGDNVEVAIPDLFADTNNDGSLDGGDVLYGLVDMSVYLHSTPTWTEGETLSIVNGVSAALPGMMFSTTEFTFDPSSGFTGTDFTGDAEIEAEHDVAATPEPAAAGLAVAGLLAIGLMERGRRLKLQ